MQDVVKELEKFEALAQQPNTKVVMDRLSRELCMNFTTPAKTLIEQAGQELGLLNREMDAFFRFWSAAQS